MTKQDQIKELSEVIKKDYPEVNAEHIATIAVEWFGGKMILFNIGIKLTADQELSLFRKTSDGTHYILIGNTNNDISYVFISNTPGSYSSLHVEDGHDIDKIIELFLKYPNE